MHLVVLMTLAMFSFGCGGSDTGGGDTSGESAAPNPDAPAEHSQDGGSDTGAPAE